MRDWERHYREAADLRSEPSPVLVEVAGLLPPGQALDLACGAGRHALHLAQLGWRVTAVDASAEGIQRLREAMPAGTQVDARVADLTSGEFQIEPAAYDLICDFYYLQRDLFDAIRAGVRPGGTFVGAIHVRVPGRESEFALEPGELREFFNAWKVLYYSEAAEATRSRPAAQIIARRA